MAARSLPAHLQVPWNGRDAVMFCLVWFGLQFAVVFWLSVLSVTVPGLKFIGDLLASENVWVSLSYSVFDAVVGFALLWLLLRKYRTSWQALGWRRFNVVRMIGYLLGLLVAFSLLIGGVLWLVSVLVPSFDANQPQNTDFGNALHTYPSIALFALVVLPPIIEETVFRGFLFPAISKRTGLVWGSVISSVLFGLAHWQANISVYTFVLGLILCFMYIRLRSIVPGVMLHMLNNLLAYWAMTSR